MKEVYAVGDKCETGEEISHIYGQTRSIAIFAVIKDEEKGIRWEINDSPFFDDTIFKIYHRLANSVPSEVEKKARWSLHEELAAALFNALTSTNKDDSLKSFEHITRKIKNLRTPNQNRLYFFGFVISSATLMLLLMLFLLLLDFINEQIILCAICGIIGAVLSTLQRATNFNIADDEKIIFIAFQAFVINIVGLLSGISIYIVSNSDIAFSFAKDNIYNLMTVSLVAGFAERYIPDLFGKISR